MAITATSVVAVKISSGALAAGAVSAQPPAFGIADGTAPWNVTWQGSGARTTAIPDASLDEITDPTTPTRALIGKLVSVAGYEAAYTSTVVGAYKRSGVDYVLLKSITNGAYREVLASTTTTVDG